MPCSMHGFYIFTKPFLPQKIAFTIADIIICDINHQIPNNYYHITDQNDRICVVDYISPKKTGKAYLLYTTIGIPKIFSLVEISDTNSVLITQNNKYYKIYANPYKNYFTSVSFNKNFIYEKTAVVNNLICEEATNYELQNYYGPKEPSEELIKSYINVNDNVYFQKTLSFVYSARKANKLYGHCVYQIKKNKIYCYVLLLEKYRNMFFYWNILLTDRPELETITNKLCTVDFDIINEIHIQDNSKGSTRAYKIRKEMQNNTSDSIKNEVNNKISDVVEQTNKKHNVKHDLRLFIPERNLYNFNHNRPIKFYINAITCILLEKKCVFVSNDSFRVFNFIKVCLELIKPLKWSYYLFCPLPKKLYNLLDSPFPFIIGIQNRCEEYKNYVKNNKITVFNLDNNTILYNKQKIKLPLYSSLISTTTENNLFASLNDYISAFTNIIDTARKKLIQKNCNKLQDILNNPKYILKEISEEHQTFFSKFFETRIFVNYITTINESYNKYGMFFANNTASLLIDSTSNTHFTKEEVYNLFFNLLFDNSTDTNNDECLLNNDNPKTCLNVPEKCTTHRNNNTKLKNLALIDLVVFDFFQVQDIPIVLKYYFKNYCMTKEHVKINNLIDKAESLQIFVDSETYKYINIYANAVNLQFFYFFDLSEYNISIQTEELGNITNNKKNNQLQIFVHKSNIFYYKCHIIKTSDLFTIIKYLNLQDITKKNLIELQPEIFWNIVVRFENFNLPINALPHLQYSNLDLVVNSNEVNSNCEPNKNTKL